MRKSSPGKVYITIHPSDEATFEERVKKIQTCLQDKGLQTTMIRQGIELYMSVEDVETVSAVLTEYRISSTGITGCNLAEINRLPAEQLQQTMRLSEKPILSEFKKLR